MQFFCGKLKVEEKLHLLIKFEVDKNKILQFLYNIFTKNLENYNFFMHLNNDIFSNLSKITDFENGDIDLINGFFKYESAEKDKIIFDIVLILLLIMV